MQVYFVRHGETELGSRLLHQPPSTPLSIRGQENATIASGNLKPLHPDLLLTSGLVRALETARIIGFSTGLVPEKNQLFREITRPSSLFSKSHFSFATLWYIFLSTFYAKKASWRFEDAENYTDVSNRVKETKAYLESLDATHKTVVVVSHSIYIAVMLSYLTTGRMLHVRDLFFTLLHIERIKNGEVIRLTYERETGVWSVLKNEERA